MKPKHIVLIILLAIGIAIVMSTFVDASTTKTFNEAFKHPNREFHVKTTLLKEKDVIYDAVKDPEMFQFYAKDSDGMVCKVICNKQKPFDFERAEEVMLVGKMVDESTFIASDFQTKCPSKYENEINDIQGDTSNQVGQKY